LSELARRGAGAVLIVCGLATALWWWRMEPRSDRDWTPEQSRTARAHRQSDSVVIENVRAFDWSGPGAPRERWETRAFGSDAVESVWFVLAPFERDRRGPAHAFLSFGFDDGRYLSISVEARREAGETYSILRGLLKGFELTYIVGDERDLIGSRVLGAQDDVYLYPIRASREAASALFLDVIEEASRLADRPVFYGSLRNNCTTRILRHVNRIAEPRIRYGWRLLLPGYSDALAHSLGLIDTDLPLEAARARFLVNDRVRAHIADSAFSARIRPRA